MRKKDSDENKTNLIYKHLRLQKPRAYIIKVVLKCQAVVAWFEERKAAG
jgi:hypothetical protein